MIITTNHLLGLLIIVSNYLRHGHCFHDERCPSDGYIWCANGGGNICVVPDTIKQGYISYGGDTRWNLVPFTNTGTDGTDLRVRCERWLGDVMIGMVNPLHYCCYMNRANGFQDLSASWIGFRNRGAVVEAPPQDPSATYTVRMGTGNQWIHRPIVNFATPCGLTFFGDVYEGSLKKCHWNQVSVVPLPSSTDWTVCGNENDNKGWCEGLSTDHAQWIRFGDNGVYLFRLVRTTDGKVPCTSDFFRADPVPGTPKFCWKAPIEYALNFIDRVGAWLTVQSCGGCSEHTYKKEVGVTVMTSEQRTDSWSSSVTAKVSTSFKWGGAGGGAELSTTTSQTVTTTTSTAFSQTVAITSEYTCPKTHLYQWIFDMTQVGAISDAIPFKVKADRFYCLDAGKEPQCVPGYCSDDDCQICEAGMEVVPPAVPQDPLYLYPFANEMIEMEPQPQSFEFRWYLLNVVVSVATTLCVICVCLTAYQCMKKIHTEQAYNPVKWDKEVETEV